MEDVYTIKVKTKPDTRNLYPSERRYSASTVSGLAWVHIALAATSFLLACLALVNPNSEIKRLNLNELDQKPIDKNELVFNLTEFDEDFAESNETEEYDQTNSTQNVSNGTSRDTNYILVLAPSLLTIFALAAGVAAIMASARWYIDRNITWLFIMSCLSTIFALTSFIMIAVWLITIEEDISEFYKNRVNFKDFFVVKHSDVVDRNGSHMIIRNAPVDDDDNSKVFTKRVLSINIMIASFLELLWSILSVKISYKGMRNHYKDDNEPRGNCISVVTTIKGNNTKKIPRNGKLLPPRPDLIEHYPNSKIKRIFLAQNDNGFYLKNQNGKNKQNTDTSSEFYKERMMNFLNRCASLEGISNPEGEVRTPSVQSENVLNPIPEVTNVEINTPQPEISNRMTPVSWGDTPEHTIYNQNTLNLEKIFNFNKEIDDNEDSKPNIETKESKENSSQIGVSSHNA